MHSSWVIGTIGGHLTELDESSCQINFNATYELPFLLDAITPKQLVDNFSENIIDSFIKRVS